MRSIRFSARSRGLTGHRFTLDRSGVEVGELTLSTFLRSASLTLDAENLELRREGFAGRRYWLMRGETVVSSAEKRGVLRKVFSVRVGETELNMRSRGWTGGRFELARIDGALIGEIRRVGVLRFGAEADFPESWPLALQAFVVWIAMVAWKTDASAAAAGG